MPVQCLDLDRHQENRRRRRSPQHLDDPFRLLAQILCVGAVGAVHADSPAAGDETQNGVPGHRCAALGQLGQRSGRARDRDAGVLGGALAHEHGRRRGTFGQFVFGVFGSTELRQQPLHDVPG